MTSPAATITRTFGLAAGPAPLHVDEVEAWLAEIGPVLTALGGRPASPATSEGRRAWRAEQARLAAAVLVDLDHACAEADAEDRCPDHLSWLHTRVCAVSRQLTDPVDLPIAA